MKIVNKFKNFTGAQLLTLVSDKGSMVNVDGGMVELIPMTLPFANQVEIATKEEATYVSARARSMDAPCLVRIK